VAFRSTVAFVIIVALIALAVLDAGESAQTGKVFPERLSLFSLGAFGAFFLALVAGAVSLLATRRYRTTELFGLAGLALIVPITIAALVYIERFDVADRPLTAAYLGAYVIVGVATAAALWPRRRDVAMLLR
jgi:hypothetical protein